MTAVKRLHLLLADGPFPGLPYVVPGTRLSERVAKGTAWRHVGEGQSVPVAGDQVGGGSFGGSPTSLGKFEALALEEAGC